MGSTRVPVDHYDLRSTNTFLATASLHDLNTVVNRDAAPAALTEDGLDNGVDEDSTVVERMHDSYRASLPLEEDRPCLEDNDSSRNPYHVLTIEDVSPIESARARFLQIVVDYFITDHVIEVLEPVQVPELGPNYTGQSGQDKLSKRKTKEVQYEGDPRFALPLMYVANMYEKLVNDVNIRLASLSGFREKTIGVALEAAGGLYRRLARKFPKKGHCSFRRRELATSVETRTRFPELVIHEEKRVRFVVVNGLDIVEKPNSMPVCDAEWFKRLTGRHEVAVSARDYKFYSPRHKYRRSTTNPASNISCYPIFHGTDNTLMDTGQGFRSITEQQNQQLSASKHLGNAMSHQSQFHSLHQSQDSSHFPQCHECVPQSTLPDIAQTNHSSPMAHNMTCLQPIAGGNGGGRMHVMASTPAKFCDECGAPYLRETSKFCSECGVKRLGI